MFWHHILLGKNLQVSDFFAHRMMIIVKKKKKKKKQS